MTSMIEWKEDYSTGFSNIDEQHKDLFRHINELGRIAESKTLRPNQIITTLVFLEAYCENHFKVEEKCMHRYQCPSSEINKAAHQSFLEAVQKFEQLYKKNIGDQEALLKIIGDLHAMATDWILGHICKIDIRLREVSKNKPLEE